MKILVFAHQLEIGGTQTNAIELSAALRDLHGHEVCLFATPGPAVKLVEQKGLRYIPAPEALTHPSPSRMRALRRAVHGERPDVIHVWDWWQCLDAYYTEHLLKGIPMVVSDMNMSLTRILPKNLPTTFGTPEIVDLAKAAGRTRVDLLLPPVDVGFNAADAVDPGPLRERYDLKDDDITLVSVSRLDMHMKVESLTRTLEAVRTLGRDLPLRFLIVGDGPSRERLEASAATTNAELGRRAVMFTGALLDPRPAYAAADIVVGMGGSALRGMAFGKPVVVVGERGFSLPLTPATADSLYYKGMYGIALDDQGNQRHATDIRELATQSSRGRAALGEFARQFVVRHFALEAVSTQLAQLCLAAASATPQFRVAALDGLRTAGVWLRERRLLSYALRERMRW